MIGEEFIAKCCVSKEIQYFNKSIKQATKQLLFCTSKFINIGQR